MSFKKKDALEEIKIAHTEKMQTGTNIEITVDEILMNLLSMDPEIEIEFRKTVQKRINDAYIICHLFNYMLGVKKYHGKKASFVKSFYTQESWEHSINEHLHIMKKGGRQPPKGTSSVYGHKNEKTTRIRRTFAPVAHLWAAHFAGVDKAECTERGLGRFLALAEAYRHEANRQGIWDKIFLKTAGSTEIYRVPRLIRVSDEGQNWVHRLLHHPLAPPPVPKPTSPAIREFLKSKRR